MWGQMEWAVNNVKRGKDGCVGLRVRFHQWRYPAWDPFLPLWLAACRSFLPYSDHLASHKCRDNSVENKSAPISSSLAVEQLKPGMKPYLSFIITESFPSKGICVNKWINGGKKKSQPKTKPKTKHHSYKEQLKTSGIWARLFVEGCWMFCFVCWWGRLVGGVGSSLQYWLFAVLLPMATQHPAQMHARLGTHCSACPCSQSVVREGRMCVVSLPFIFCQLKRLCCSMRISPPGCGLFTAHRAGSGVSRDYARALLQLYVSVRREKCSVLIWQ